MKVEENLSIEQFIAVIKEEIEGVKIYMDEDIAQFNEFAAKVMFYDGLKKIFATHHVVRDKRLMSFGTQFVKMEEWFIGINYDSGKRRGYLEIITNGVLDPKKKSLFVNPVSPRIWLPKTSFNIVIVKEVKECLDELVAKYFLVFTSILVGRENNSHLYVGKDEFEAHNGEIAVQRV